MYNISFFGTFDLTALILLSFVLFFLGLVVYLRREDRREGYPLEDEAGRLEPTPGLLFFAQPKTFNLPHGQGVLTKPNSQRESQVVAARAATPSPGSPLIPTGDPMRDGVGPAAYAERARVPDRTLHGAPKIVPLRVAAGFSLDARDPDPRGMTVVGADRVAAGVVSDAWVDRSEYMIRYLEVTLYAANGGRQVLLPMTMAVIDKRRNHVRVDAILAAHFAHVPGLEHPDQVTFYEEERVCAYYGGGHLYATRDRSEPLL